MLAALSFAAYPNHALQNIPSHSYNRDPLPRRALSPLPSPVVADTEEEAVGISAAGFAALFAVSLNAFGSRRKLSSPEKRLHVTDCHQ